MKKLFATAVLCLMPLFIFAEITFVPHLGFDVHKGVKNNLIDSKLGDLIKSYVPGGIPVDKIPYSRPLVPMFTLGLDMHLISHRSGFTFFWNNDFSFSERFVAEEQLSASASTVLQGLNNIGNLNDLKNIDPNNINPNTLNNLNPGINPNNINPGINPNGNIEDQINALKKQYPNINTDQLQELAKEGNTEKIEQIVKQEVLNNTFVKKVGTFKEKQKMMFYATELLMGGTFRREKALNIYFGIGLKLGVSLSTITLVQDVMAGKMQNPKSIPDKMVAMVLPAFGGTFGISYYFNRFIGLSVSVNDFVGLGAFVSTNILERHKGLPADYKGYPTKAVAYTSVGLHNDFAMKFGLNIRFFGVKK